MFSGPLFRREFGAASRRRRPFVVRTFVAAVLGLAMVGVGLAVFSGHMLDGVVAGHSRVAWFGRIAFLVTFCVEMALLVFLVPNHVSGAVAEEREKDTLPFLLLTRLTPLEIVATKTVARWLSVLQPVLIGVPLLMASAWLSGLERELVLALVVLATSSALMASLAMLASCRREQANAAGASAFAWTLGWLVGPPFLTIMPGRPGTLWGDLLAELKSLCGVIAPSSPLSLVTDRGWFFRPESVRLEDQVAWMVGLQGLLGLVALGYAAGGLKARERNPNWLDPTRGYRPACGDDPIHWREYDLPMRRGGGSLVGLRLRFVWILIRATLMNLSQLLAVLLLLAVPIGLLLATLHFGHGAFQELWRHGYGPDGPFDERSQFGMVIRAATGMLALFPALILPTLISGRITAERDKKTWETFLTTPLDGAEIFRSKARAALSSFWHSASPLPLLWALGIACGVATPVGVALAAVDLASVAWFGVALGFFLGVRPGTTATASSWWSAASLFLVFAIHAPVLWGSLTPAREYAAIVNPGAPSGWLLPLSGLLIPIITAAVASHLARRSVDRFDEWAGRPFKAGADGTPAASPAGPGLIPMAPALPE